MDSGREDHEGIVNEFDELVNAYQASLLKMCALLLRDRSLAEDAVQETLIKAYRALPKLRQRERIKSWLMRIAVNTCRDYQRSAWFKQRKRQVTADVLRGQAASGDDDAARDLALSISLLPAREREVILLYYYQDMTMEEIARTLCTAVSTVSRRHKRALRALRSLSEEEN